MRFEYDLAKSASNLTKHGIDFDEAQRLWQDPRLAIVDARTDIETRSIAIGRIDDRHWSAVHTQRGSSIRLISVRRARALEVRYYEGP